MAYKIYQDHWLQCWLILLLASGTNNAISVRYQVCYTSYMQVAMSLKVLIVFNLKKYQTMLYVYVYLLGGLADIHKQILCHHIKLTKQFQDKILIIQYILSFKTYFQRCICICLLFTYLGGNCMLFYCLVSKTIYYITVQEKRILICICPIHCNKVFTIIVLGNFYQPNFIWTLTRYLLVTVHIFVFVFIFYVCCVVTINS